MYILSNKYNMNISHQRIVDNITDLPCELIHYLFEFIGTNYQVLLNLSQTSKESHHNIMQFLNFSFNNHIPFYYKYMLAHNVINDFINIILPKSSSESMYNIYEFLDKNNDKITDLLLTKNLGDIEQKAKIKFNMLSNYTKFILISSVMNNTCLTCFFNNIYENKEYEDDYGTNTCLYKYGCLHNYVGHVKQCNQNEIGNYCNIHDNGGQPFLVHVTKKTITIYNRYDWDGCGKLDSQKNKIMNISPYKKVFLPNYYEEDNDEEDNDEEYYYEEDNFFGGNFGNSILINTTKNTYIFIGENIYKFDAKEQINIYRSRILNNDAPYPYVVSDNYTYLMIEGVYLKNEEIKTKDPYHHYYGMGAPKLKGYKFKNIILQKRL